MKQNILVFVAHSDDQILGPGGTLAKLSKKYNIITYIFSYGEKSHPHIKPKIIIKKRIEEAKKADKIIGGKELYFFNFPEGKFIEYYKKHNYKNKIIKIIKKYKPIKIFTHSKLDAHSDHIAVNNIIYNIYEEMKLNIPLLTFEIWNIFRKKHKSKTKLIVEISDTFKIKHKAINQFKSQYFAMFLPYIEMYIKAFLNGLKYNKKFVEIFERVK